MIPMRTNVTENCRSMAAAAVDAPTGNHQVLATKKYVLTNVISQIKQRRTRPIYLAPLSNRRDRPRTHRCASRGYQPAIGRSLSQLDVIWTSGFRRIKSQGHRASRSSFERDGCILGVVPIDECNGFE